ncbi:MAG: hypothetical protein ABGX16_00535 [Pirellulales bacterium]
MKNQSWLLLMGTVLALQTLTADWCRGDGGWLRGKQPRLQFLDDQAHPCCPDSSRNPYEERIETERHDFTQSTVTVGRGVFQLESGYTYFFGSSVILVANFSWHQFKLPAIEEDTSTIVFKGTKSSSL